MHFSSRAAAFSLLAVGGSLATANVVVTGLRTTIPRSLDAEVVERAALNEKHPGFDDACLLELDDARTIQVDPEIYGAVASRDRLQKVAWERTLRVGDRDVPLDWSNDVRGMAWLMPLAFIVMLVQASYAAIAGRSQ